MENIEDNKPEYFEEDTELFSMKQAIFLFSLLILPIAYFIVAVMEDTSNVLMQDSEHCEVAGAMLNYDAVCH